jgi:hypothetical protein
LDAGNTCYTRPRVPAPWLIFAHQLPARPSNGRVRLWRRLRQLGAVPVKNAVHVLRNTPESKEDFEWLRTEVAALGGTASVFAASTLKDADERRLRSRLRQKKKQARPAARRAGGRVARAASASGDVDLRQLRGRLWVTRPRPGVDRFGSAWLIRRFFDPAARFVFAGSPDKFPDAIPFDMYQPGGFAHQGNLCTFEVLQQAFGVTEPAVTRIAEIVHDVDLRDDRYGSPHAASVAALVEGLRASFADDAKLLEQGIVMFEALYQSKAAR